MLRSRTRSTLAKANAARAIEDAVYDVYGNDAPEVFCSIMDGDTEEISNLLRSRSGDPRVKEIMTELKEVKAL